METPKKLNIQLNSLSHPSPKLLTSGNNDHVGEYEYGMRFFHIWEEIRVRFCQSATKGYVFSVQPSTV